MLIQMKQNLLKRKLSGKEIMKYLFGRLLERKKNMPALKTN